MLLLMLNALPVYALPSSEDLSLEDSLAPSLNNFGVSAQHPVVSDEIPAHSDKAMDNALSVCTDAKLGVRFSCDPDWKIETDENVLMIIISDQPNVTMTITRTSPGPESLESLTMSAIKEIGNYADGFTVYRTTLNGKPVVEIRGASAKINDLHLHDYYFLENGALYGILFSITPFDAVQEYDTLIKKMITMFEFIPVDHPQKQ